MNISKMLPDMAGACRGAARCARILLSTPVSRSHSTRRFIAGTGLLAGLLILITGCTQRQNAATAVITLPASTPVTILVTRTPAPTATPTLSPTPPFDLSTIGASWQFNLVFTLHADTTFSDIQYSGSAPLTIDADGKISGDMELYGSVQKSSCGGVLMDDQPQTTAIKGLLRKDDKGNLVGDITLSPHDTYQMSTLRLDCANSTEANITEALLWPAVREVNALTLAILFQEGANHQEDRTMIANTADTLQGSVTIYYSLSR